MADRQQAIEQTESRLTEVEAFQRTIKDVEADLNAYAALLRQKLDLLRADDESVDFRSPESAAIPIMEDEPPPVMPAAPTLPVARPTRPTPTGPRPAARPESGPLQRPAALRPSGEIPRPPAARTGSGDIPRPARPGGGDVPRPAARAESTDVARTARGGSRFERMTAAEPPPPPAAAPPVAESSSEERRTAPRRKGNPISVQVSNAAASTEPFQGWVVDRSSGGLRLLVDQAVAPGSILSVRPSKTHPSNAWVQIQVRSCRPERSSFNLGCMFVEKLTWAEMQMFG